MSESETDLPFWDHVEALRQALLRIILTVGISTFLCFYFHQPLFHLLTRSLETFKQGDWEQVQMVQKRITNTSEKTQTFTLSKKAQPNFPLHTKIIQKSSDTFLIPPGQYLDYLEPVILFVSSPIEGFSAMLRLAFWCGLTLSSPLWMWLIFGFITPALNKKTKRQFFFFFILSILLFILGNLFAYFFTIPLANHYFFSYNSEIGFNFWNLSSYLEYSLILLMGNGLGFEISGILYFMIWSGYLTVEHLKNFRRYAYVSIFIFSAVMTPPDIFSQIMLAIPLTLLYESSFLYARYRSRPIRESQLTLTNLKKEY